MPNQSLLMTQLQTYCISPLLQHLPSLQTQNSSTANSKVRPTSLLDSRYLTQGVPVTSGHYHSILEVRLYNREQLYLYHQNQTHATCISFINLNIFFISFSTFTNVSILVNILMDQEHQHNCYDLKRHQNFLCAKKWCGILGKEKELSNYSCSSHHLERLGQDFTQNIIPYV